MAIQKRGLSEVVTTVLIILLVLVAIGIIWAAVRPTIENSGSRISGDCLTLQLGTQSCTPGTTGVFDVSVMRKVGAGNLLAVKLIFSNVTDTVVIEQPTTVGELDTASFAAIDSGLEGNVTVKSAGVVGLTGGSSQTCPVESATTTCAP